MNPISVSVLAAQNKHHRHTHREVSEWIEGSDVLYRIWNPLYYINRSEDKDESVVNE